MLYGSEAYRIANAAAGCFVTSPWGHESGALTHCNYLLQVVIDGTLDVKLANRPWQSLPSPAAWLVLPGERVNWRYGDIALQMAFIHFTVSRNAERDAMEFNRRFDLNWPDRMRFIEPGPVQVWGKSIGGMVPEHLAQPLAQEASSMCSALESDDVAMRTAAEMRLESMLLSWLTLDHDGDQTLQISEAKDVVDRTLVLLEHMGPETSGVTKLAGVVGVDPRFLAYHFKAVTGRSLEDALLESRMRAAAKRLRRTRNSIPEIASVVGYADPSGFRRMFKRQYGCTPSEYRRRHKLGRL